MKRSFSLFSLLFVVALGAFAQATAKVAFLSLGGAQTSETNAKDWFNNTYVTPSGETKEVITSLADLSNYKALWIHIDRKGLEKGVENLPEYSMFNTDAFRNWVKNGGRLLLTAHATQLVSVIGGNIATYAPNEFSNGNGGPNSDTWGVNPHNQYRHPIFKDLPNKIDDAWYPLVGDGFKQDHNCLWNLYDDGGYNKGADDFERDTHSRILGTWEWADTRRPAIVEFLPDTQWKGTVLACGIAAFDWEAGAKNANFEKFAKNMVDYMLSSDNYTQDFYRTRVDAALAPGEGSGNLVGYDGAIYKLDTTNKTAILWGADKTKMYIVGYPRTLTVDGIRYDVVGIDPRVRTIPLKFVDIDKGNDHWHRDDACYDLNVALNPHEFFMDHVIVYVYDIQVNGKGGEVNTAECKNVCKASVVNWLYMEDFHPLQFPGMAEKAFDALKITFTRQFTPGVTGTIVLPFNMTRDEMDQIGTFYTFTGYEGGKLKFHILPDDETFHANTPYVIWPKTTQFQELGSHAVLPTVSYNESGLILTEPTTDKGSYKLVASYDYLIVYGKNYDNADTNYPGYATMRTSETQSAKDMGIYAYDPSGVFRTSSGYIGCRTFRAYIVDNSTGSASAKSSKIEYDLSEEDVTGINQAKYKSANDGVVYNIMGQRTQSAKNGIYILNGKKYIKK